MKILIYSPYFYPRIGGVEVIARGLAEKFSQYGNEVVVVTDTQSKEADEFPFIVVRNAKASVYMKIFMSCDVYIQMNVSLRGIYPFLFSRKAFYIYHQNTYYKNDGSITLNGRLKYLVASLAKYNVCCSQYVADYIRKNKKVIGNPYNEDTFRSDIPWQNRENDIVFLGRLVSDKGCNTLIEALNLLHLQGKRLRLGIIGEGPEKNELLKLTEKYQLSNFVKFYGSVSGKELNELLNRYKIMVVPSIWKEPFGIVALEGLAAGCRLIVSEYGGLKEAVGKYGHTFPNGDVDAIVKAIQKSMYEPSEHDVNEIAAHLKDYSLETISKKFLKVITG